MFFILGIITGVLITTACVITLKTNESVLYRDYKTLQNRFTSKDGVVFEDSATLEDFLNTKT